MARGTDVKGLLGIWQEATGEGEDGLLKLMQNAVQRVLEEEMTDGIPQGRATQEDGYANWLP